MADIVFKITTIYELFSNKKSQKLRPSILCLLCIVVYVSVFGQEIEKSKLYLIRLKYSE
jgi:hypothetical protein